MNPEALDALQKVVALSPENILAQKLLSQIYMDSGDYEPSKKALEAILALNPADTESRLLLESLERVATPTRQDESDILASAEPDAFNFQVELDSLEGDAEELETLDLLDELEEVDGLSSCFAEQETLPPVIAPAQEEEPFYADTVDHPVGIRTATIAELYVTQGHLEQAVEIYRELFAASPGNLDYRKRLEELEGLLAEDELPPKLELPDEMLSTVEPEMLSFADDLSTTPAPDSETLSVPAEGNDELVVLLQGWLDNIRRARECHSGRD
jgi:tetratricopeptide (TPR) repeat protein